MGFYKCKAPTLPRVVNNDTGGATFTWLFSGSMASDQSLTCDETGIFAGNSCTITGPLGTVGNGQLYGPPPGIMPGQTWNPNATITFTGLSAGSLDLTFAGFDEGDTNYIVDGDVNQQCTTSLYQGVCGPYLYPPVTGSNGINVDINNAFWGYTPSLALSYGETLAQMQSMYATDPGNWYVIEDFPTGKTAIETYPATHVMFYYPGYWVEGVGGSAPLVSSFSYIYSSFGENMNDPPTNTTIDAEAAYDIWLNGYNNEVMIWNDLSNRGGATEVGGCSTHPGATGLVFGGSNGVPVNTWEFVKCSSELIFELQQSALPSTPAPGESGLNQGTPTVFGIQNGSVDILSMFEWLMAHGTTNSRTGVFTPYLPATSTLTQIQYGFEIASTGGVPETFQVNDFSLNYAIPGIVPTTPTISWATPAAITYGTALSATQLDAAATNPTNSNNGNIPGSPVAGTYVYSPALGTVLTAGTQTLSVTFTPTDTIDYTTATQTVQLTVNQATPAITWATPAAVTYGTALSAAQLDATANVAGTFAYSPAAGTVLAAGNQMLTVAFTPTDTTDYTAAGQAVQLTVNPAALTVAANSIAVTYGTTPVLTATITGFVNGDTLSVVSGAPALGTTATSASLPGSYPISVGQGTLFAANYSFTLVGGTVTVGFTASVPASGNSCNGAYSGTFSGNVTPSAGQTCIFVGGGVTGNVQQNGGNLELIQSSVGGDLQVNGGGMFTVTTGSTIHGNLQVQNLPTSSATDLVCGSTVQGDLQFQNNATAVLIGTSLPSAGGACPGNTINGNLTIQNNTASVSAVGNTVGKNLTVQNNTAATVVDSNTVTGNLQDTNNQAPTDVSNDIVGNNLQCQNNSSITGGGDTAGSLQGQCSTY